MEKSWKFQGVGGQTGKNPPWGGYGYFLEPHIVKVVLAPDTRGDSQGFHYDFAQEVISIWLLGMFNALDVIK